MFFKAEIKKKLYRFTLDISLKLEKNQYTIMLGPSGAGKSMTLKIIAGVEKGTYQRVYIDGEDVSDFPPEKRSIVYLPQKNSLFPHMNVFENLIFPFHALRVKIDNNLLKNVINSFGIDHIINRKPDSLSGGEARRVTLARAICAKPKLLLLDEPLSFLDFHIRQELIEFLKKVTKEYQITVLHVTHDPIEAFLLAQKVYVLRNGKIIFYGDPNQQMDKEALFNLIKRLASLISIP